MEERQENIAVDLKAVALRLLGEGLVDARLPVDQRAVDVEGDKGDVLGQRHRAMIMPCGGSFMNRGHLARAQRVS